MKYFLGIDGGGTKTKLIIINTNDEIIFETVTGPSSVDTVSITETFTAFKDGIDLFLDTNKRIELSAVFAGLGGIVYEEQKNLVISIIKDLPMVTSDTIIMVENDMHNALYSGLLFDEGIALIAGTGMVAYGKDLYGNQAKCGGWGFKEGDLGSGYSLGVSAIRHMIRSYDGRLPNDLFAKDIAQVFSLQKDTDIIKILDKYFTDRTKIASLAPIVTKHANLDNKYALQIIDNATNELALAVKGVYGQIKLANKKLVIVGTLGNVDGQFKNNLHKKIMEIDNEITIISPIVDPAFAAALMAKNLFNI